MAEVTGFTADRMLAMEDATIIDAHLDGYDLVLTTKGGTEVNVGDVRGPIGPVGPVGEVEEAPNDGMRYVRSGEVWIPGYSAPDADGTEGQVVAKLSDTLGDVGFVNPTIHYFDSAAERDAFPAYDGQVSVTRLGTAPNDWLKMGGYKAGVWHPIIAWGLNDQTTVYGDDNIMFYLSNGEAARFYADRFHSRRAVQICETKPPIQVGQTSNVDEVQFRTNGTMIKRQGESAVYGAYWVQNSGGSGVIIGFFQHTSSIARGSIQHNGTAISYLTTSDYRLKENDVEISDGLERVRRLRPITFDWKETGERDEGFFAHEAGKEVPVAVIGEKDAMLKSSDPECQPILDDDGNIIEGAMHSPGDIIPQQLEKQALVPTLTAAIKDLDAIVTKQAETIAQLTARLEALEAT